MKRSHRRKLEVALDLISEVGQDLIKGKKHPDGLSDLLTAGLFLDSVLRPNSYVKLDQGVEERISEMGQSLYDDIIDQVKKEIA